MPASKKIIGINFCIGFSKKQNYTLQFFQQIDNIHLLRTTLCSHLTLTSARENLSTFWKTVYRPTHGSFVKRFRSCTGIHFVDFPEIRPTLIFTWEGNVHRPTGHVKNLFESHWIATCARQTRVRVRRMHAPVLLPQRMRASHPCGAKVEK